MASSLVFEHGWQNMTSFPISLTSSRTEQSSAETSAANTAKLRKCDTLRYQNFTILIFSFINLLNVLKYKNILVNDLILENSVFAVISTWSSMAITMN